MSDTIFSKIIRKEIPAEFVHEDDQCIAIKDTNAQAPVHILVIPKKPIAKLADATVDDEQLLGHLLLVAGKISQELGIDDAFRLVINNGSEAGQTVFHLHLHVVGGRRFEWPPG